MEKKKRKRKDLKRLRGTKSDYATTMLKTDDLVHILSHRKISVCTRVAKRTGEVGAGPPRRASRGRVGRWGSVGEPRGGENGVIVSGAAVVTTGSAA